MSANYRFEKDEWYVFNTALFSFLLVFCVVEQASTLKILLQADNRNKILTPFLVNISLASIILVLSSLPASIASNIYRGWLTDRVTCSVLGFASTVAVLVQADNRNKILTPFLVNISLANIILVLSSLPASIASNIYRGWLTDRVTCSVLGFASTVAVLVTFGTFAGCTRTLHQSWISIKISNTRRNSDIKAILAIWVFSVAFSIPAVPFWNQASYELSIFGCVPLWKLQTVPHITYFVLLALLGFGLPVTVSIVSAIRIYRFITRIKPGIHLSSRQLQRRKSYKITCKMLITASIIYLICWSPYAVIGTLSISGYPISAEQRNIPHLISKSSVLWNPFIYAVFNARFRAAVRNFFLCEWRKSKNEIYPVQMTIPATETRQARPRPRSALATVTDQGTPIEVIRNPLETGAGIECDQGHQTFYATLVVVKPRAESSI